MIEDMIMAIFTIIASFGLGVLTALLIGFMLISIMLFIQTIGDSND